MSTGGDQPNIAKLDYPEANQHTPLLHQATEDSRPPSPAAPANARFWEQVAEGVQQRDRKDVRRETLRYVSFFWAVVCTLCCGSITAFSLYAPLFQTRLYYTQAQINVVSIVAELALYLLVPLFGFVVDRRGPRPLALLASVLFGSGYFLAAFTYRSGPPPENGGHGWPFPIMAVAFVGVGTGTCCMYLAAVATCAKNFGRGKHRGAALAIPIACFGLSGMWQSQIGAHVLCERNPDGTRGDVDVFRYFIFLGVLLVAAGIVGSFLLRIVDEEHMIEAAVESLEASGLLDDSSFFRPQGYGTLDQETTARRPSTRERADRAARKAQRLNERRKKTWLLNAETRQFLLDPTMWFLTAGFFLVSGTGETFINNLGTLIGTLYPSPSKATEVMRSQQKPTSPATHVSIVAIASTIARIASGTLSDLFGPKPMAEHQHHTRRRRHASLSSISSLDPLTHSQASLPSPETTSSRLTISRLTFLIISTFLLSLGQLLLASGAVQEHAHSRFWLVSALAGTGYGATFSLVPIIISCVWGVENFGTNWGIVATAPAFGSALWGLAYAWVYEFAGSQVGKPEGAGSLGSWLDEGVRIGLGMLQDSDDQEAIPHDNSGRCYGKKCYQSTFWGMAVASWLAIGLWIWAWRGKGGWRERGVRV